MSGEPGLNPIGVYLNVEYSGGSVVRAPCCKLSPVVSSFDNPPGNPYELRCTCLQPLQRDDSALEGSCRV